MVPENVIVWFFPTDLNFMLLRTAALLRRSRPLSTHTSLSLSQRFSSRTMDIVASATSKDIRPSAT